MTTKTAKEIAGDMRARVQEIESEKRRLQAAAWFLDPVGRMPVEATAKRRRTKAKAKAARAKAK